MEKLPLPESGNDPKVLCKASSNQTRPLLSTLIPEVCVPPQLPQVAGYAYSVTPWFVPGCAWFTFSSPIMPTHPSDHQTLPLGSTVIRCGVNPPAELLRILYSFNTPPEVCSPIIATDELSSVNQTLFEPSTTMPYG